MKIHILIIGLVILSACSKEPNITNENQNSYINEVSENIIATEPSVYSNYFNNEGPMVGYSSMQEHSLADNSLNSVNTESNSSLKSGKTSFSVFANGIDIVTSQSSLKSSQLNANNNLFENWYGKNVEFIIKKDGLLKSGSLSEQDTINMYIPNLVHITSPEIKVEKELFPFCYYDNFKLAWNPDVDNKNGLVVIVEWNGTVLSEDGDSKEYIRNIDVIPNDNGEVILNSQLFNNIPDRALTYVTLLRGNISLVESGGITYSLFGESHAVLPIILIRDIDK